MTKLEELKRRIKRNLKRNEVCRSRFDFQKEYREGYCAALRGVLDRIEQLQKP